MATNGFQGFSPQLFEFLVDLGGHNDRDWFAKNKNRYEEFWREPSLAYIRSMSSRLAKISKSFVCDDRKVGGSLMRIFRDTRFSSDKTPYKTNVGIQFRHVAGKDVHAPGFYTHIALDGIFLGAGVWHPDGPALDKIRTRIVANSGRWKSILKSKSFSTHWEPHGDSLKRPPRGYPKDHPLVEELKRKDFIALTNLKPKEVQSAQFLDLAAKRFGAAKKYVQFLCEALELPF